MGVIYSIPLCSRGEAAKEVEGPLEGADTNNNQPMPTMHHVPVSSSPVAAVVASQPQSLANQNADFVAVFPDATSTPKSDNQRRIVLPTPASDVSSDDIIDVDDEDALTGGDRTSDSGLEQSSSDELEMGGANVARRPMSRREQRVSESPESESDRPAPPPMPAADEGINEETLDVTIPLGNQLTGDEGSSDEEEDPVERPPEPTVPDERVDSSEDGSRQESVSPTAFKKFTAEGDTTNAISSLLSEIVGGDHPYEEAPRQFQSQMDSERAVAR